MYIKRYYQWRDLLRVVKCFFKKHFTTLKGKKNEKIRRNYSLHVGNYYYAN